MSTYPHFSEHMQIHLFLQNSKNLEAWNKIRTNDKTDNDSLLFSCQKLSIDSRGLDIQNLPVNNN